MTVSLSIETGDSTTMRAVHSVANNSTTTPIASATKQAGSTRAASASASASASRVLLPYI
jgi:hypothetical protein